MTHTSDDPTALQSEWERLQEQRRSGTQGTAIEHDISGAQLLTDAADEGMMQKEIAKAIGKGHPTVARLLRYHRFLKSDMSVGISLAERKFRAYWQQISHPNTTGKWTQHTPQPVIDEYEALVFSGIASQVKEGKEPIRMGRRRVPKTAEELLASAAPMKAIEKEALTLYREEVAPIVKGLRSLMRTDRSRYSPDTLADYARRLEKGMKRIFDLFSTLSKRR